MKDESVNGSRRAFVKAAAAGAVILSAGGGTALFSGCGKKGAEEALSSLALPPLPYPANALAPYMSEKTLGFHHGRHHANYVKKLGELVKGTEYSEMDISAIIRKSSKDPGAASIFNNAAQAHNHAFFWLSMKPKGGGLPGGAIKSALEKSFGSLDAFRKTFLEAASSVFGSGWVWLTSDGGKLAVVKTANADTPVTSSTTPLLCLDVWEHAYYLDYQDKRADYAAAWLDHMVDWNFADKNLAG